MKNSSLPKYISVATFCSLMRGMFLTFTSGTFVDTPAP